MGPKSMSILEGSENQGKHKRSTRLGRMGPKSVRSFGGVLEPKRKPKKSKSDRSVRRELKIREDSEKILGPHNDNHQTLNHTGTYVLQCNRQDRFTTGAKPKSEKAIILCRSYQRTLLSSAFGCFGTSVENTSKRARQGVISLL